MARKPRRQSNDEVSAVGDIVHSILSEAQFQTLRGANWVLCDGRSVAGSRLATQFGITNVPDARGQFLRGKNNGRADGQQDPGGERNLGSQQTDAFQGHHHEAFGTNGAGAVGAAFGANAGNLNNNIVRAATPDGTNGTPRTANETRPKNIAVNIFIRIN